MTKKTKPRYHISILQGAVQIVSLTTENPKRYTKLLLKEYEGLSVIITKFFRTEVEDYCNDVIWDGVLDYSIVDELEL